MILSAIFVVLNGFKKLFVEMKNLVNIVPQPQQHPQDGERGTYA